VSKRAVPHSWFSLLRDGVITADAAHETIVEMLDAGWYCSPDLYARIRQRIDDLA
jgi:hypothetical protein